MGSLVSVPKLSTTPQPQQTVRYVQAPQVSASTAPSSSSSSSSSGNGSTSNSSTSTPSAANIAAAREDNLLRRSRGLSGTIQTSFRGLLGLNNTPQRKTLLGE